MNLHSLHRHAPQSTRATKARSVHRLSLSILPSRSIQPDYGSYPVFYLQLPDFCRFSDSRSDLLQLRATPSRIYLLLCMGLSLGRTKIAVTESNQCDHFRFVVPSLSYSPLAEGPRMLALTESLELPTPGLQSRSSTN